MKSANRAIINAGLSGPPRPLEPTLREIVREEARLAKHGEVVRKRRGTTSEAHLKAPHLTNSALHVADLSPNALVRIDEAARYLRYEGVRAAEMCAKFLRSKHITLHRRGTRLLVRRGDLDVALTRRADPAVAAVSQDIADQIATRRLKRAAVG